MAKILFKNNAYSTLSAGISDSATSISVQTGHGDRFPAVTGTDIAYITLEDSSGNREIVKVTARSGGSDSMTIVRGQEGTAARAFSSGDVVEQRITAGELARYEMLSNVEDSASKTTPANNDKIPLKDSAASDILKYLTWANLLAALPAAGFTIGTPQSPSGVAYVDFTGITAKIIAVSGVGVSTNGSSELIIQLGDSGGAETSGYTGRVGGGSSYTLGSYNGVVVSSGPAAATVMEFLVFFVLVDSSTNTWAFFGGAAPAGTPITVTGNKSLTGTLDRVRVTVQNGTDTFDAGKINVAYL